MPPDDRARLHHMLDAAREAVAFARGRRRGDLAPGDIATHGLVRLLEIIGEAAARTSPAARAALPSVPWPLVVSMRNRIVHGYYEVDLDVVWETTTDSLPPLIAELERHLADGA